MTPTAPLLQLHDLRIRFRGDPEPVVDGVDITVHRGEIVALVGESGSGKSLTARAVLGLLPPTAAVSGQIDLHSHRGRHTLLPDPGPRGWQGVRGLILALIPQDALGALDPLRRIEHEVGDALRVHRVAAGAARRTRVVSALEAAGIPDAAQRLRLRADELSGGLRQRALVAAALVADPELIIADEPTTALDAAHRGRVLAQLRQRADGGAGALLISHDLTSVRNVADRVLVMHRGAIVDSGPTVRVLSAPSHAMTRELITASPAGKPRGVRLLAPTAPTAPIPPDYGGRDATIRLELRHISKSFGRTEQQRTVLDNTSLIVRDRETVGLLGESGSGKTTLLRVALGLLAPDSGRVLLDGIDRATAARSTRRRLRQQLAFVPQDPLDSFPIGASGDEILRDALRAAGVPRASRTTRIARLAEEVSLGQSELRRPAATLSGGQRQRLAIARALARNPQLLLLDEPVSALDLTVQARVLDLLDELQRQRGTSYLLVSHDEDVIRHMSDRIVRLHRGRLEDVR